MYVELHAHSYYSLLDGVPSPEALVQRAADLEMPALALTDHDALYGVARFARAAEQDGIKPIFGAELTLTNGGGHLTLLAQDETGYANLCRLITLARRDQQKGLAALPWRWLADHSKGLIALSGCRRSEIARALLDRDARSARRFAERFVAIFGRDNFFLELQRHHQRGDRRLSTGLTALAQQLDVRLVATGNVHYLSPDEAPLHDVLTCIHHRVSLDQANDLLRSNAEYYFRSPDEMAALFAEWPDALRATLDIAERCHARLPAGPQTLPSISILPAPYGPGHSPAEHLRHLCQAALERKGHRREAEDGYQATLDREMSIIVEQELAGYFLIVWDLVRFARSQGILCQGRGSAANSLVAYLLDITPIDPLSAGLVFERFLSRERATAPDIDVDFDAHRREEVIQYLYRQYGHDHVAMACTVVTFGAKQAVRDVGMVLGFPSETLDRVSASVEGHSASAGLRATFDEQIDTPRWQQFLSLAAALDGFPRHLGIHNGGMVLCALPLAERIPIEPATMEERTVVQWDKDALEMAGWVKLDVLGLRMLSAIADACDIVAARTGQRPDLSALGCDDPKVYDMLCRGETIGVFQVESRAQATLIPRFQPRCFADLTIQIALIRPGPIQGNMVHPYLRRREGVEPVRPLHPLLELALQETLGVILFQEQVLKVAGDLAGFTPGEGDLLRRALGHKRAGEQIETFHTRFLEGARARGVSLDVAEEVFEQLKAFGGYSFSKAHAAAFAVITYWSAWLRCYHPVAFFAGLLRHQPMGFYPKHVVVTDAQRAGVRFLPVDLRASESEVTVEDDAIRLGLSYVQGFGPQQIEMLEDVRQRGPFTSLADLVRRTHLDRRHVEALVLAGALDYMGERRQLLWDIAEAYRLSRQPERGLSRQPERGLSRQPERGLSRRPERGLSRRPERGLSRQPERGLSRQPERGLSRRPERGLSRRPDELPLKSPDERVRLSPMSRGRRMATTFATTGVSLDGHLTALRRDAFTRAGARPIGDLSEMKHGQRVRIGGLVVARQKPPTAKGFAFLAVEDSEGMVNVVISPDVYAACRQAVRCAFVLVDGVVQKDHGAINVVAERVTKV